ncbi:hypothetical protein [Paracraurococcus lichenis]|uniref:Helix-turn-helix domain-containing protein n=1 Tax=Paracraurococcus lichenis TaxID=3064888 RepID=A0ABT9E8K4_9PROT|nr:hypothetical protein [Paracraurococcus sp. LOR1-02]MDO9712486.1 hypothetical protein [Paracraurococcus sp. LOR1-02]
MILPLPALHPRPWHSGSVFGEGVRRTVSIGQKALLLSRVTELWWARRITDTTLRIARRLINLVGPDGRLDPTHQELGRTTRTSDRTARRAVNILYDLGLLRWERRLKRVGWRTEQTSNAYELLTPATPKIPAAPERVRTRRRCGGQGVREERNQFNFPPTPPVLLDLPDRTSAFEALKRRREQFERETRELAAAKEAAKRRPPG